MTNTRSNIKEKLLDQNPYLRITAGAKSEPGKIRLTLLGRDWVLHRPSDLETLWDSITDDAFAPDERLPYWVELWPASLALAHWLAVQKERIHGKVCLDMGCGLGFSALTGSWSGAKVIGMDYEPEALSYASLNAAVNGIPSPLWTVMDWRQPAIAPGSCDFIWGGDVMYENRFVTPVFDFINYALAPNGVVWIAEPGRDAYENFRRALLNGGWRAGCIMRSKVDALHVQDVPVSVSLWELARQ